MPFKMKGVIYFENKGAYASDHFVALNTWSFEPCSLHFIPHQTFTGFLKSFLGRGHRKYSTIFKKLNFNRAYHGFSRMTRLMHPPMVHDGPNRFIFNFRAWR